MDISNAVDNITTESIFSSDWSSLMVSSCYGADETRTAKAASEQEPSLSSSDRLSTFTGSHCEKSKFSPALEPMQQENIRFSKTDSIVGSLTIIKRIRSVMLENSLTLIVTAIVAKV